MNSSPTTNSTQTMVYTLSLHDALPISANRAAHLLGFDAGLPVLQIVLPVGISFYTFHTITYIVDSYRGTITPTRDRKSTRLNSSHPSSSYAVFCMTTNTVTARVPPSHT